MKYFVYTVPVHRYLARGSRQSIRCSENLRRLQEIIVNYNDSADMCMQLLPPSATPDHSGGDVSLSLWY